MLAPGMLSRPRGSPGIPIPGWIIMNAQSDVKRQYVSTFWSAYIACCSNRPRCRMGSVGYMLAKKKSMQSLTISPVRRPGDGERVGLHGGLLIPFNRFATFEESVVCRCVSRSSLITFARDPFGPFFCGMAWYVHDSWADEQLRHGLIPSHLTFRR